MSHEGIRSVSPEEAEKEELEQRELPPLAKEPAKIRVHKTDGTGLEIEWKDGHHSVWTFAWLRYACPCANCHDERQKTGRVLGEPKPQPATSQLKPPPAPIVAKPVGNYAMSFMWNDGHRTGIFSWDFLRRHCQCEECRAAAGE
ncbi:MAG: DUF971 domain-containing protein [Acidobacteriaceae bacterium]